MSIPVDAETIAEALGARRYGDSWRCPCPVCGERNQTKFKIAEGDTGPLVYCFAGCDFRAIRAELKRRGLWPDERPASRAEARRRDSQREIAKARRDIEHFKRIQASIYEPSDAEYRAWDRARAVLARHGVER